jgi:hypothetical protein
MALLAMNWKEGKPPRDFVGFAISYKEPGGDRFFPIKNRLGFQRADGSVEPEPVPSTVAPIQKFRWVHFPRHAALRGEFTYRVSPVFMNADGELSYGEPQRLSIELRRETYPGRLNVTFTRGFVSSQAFVERFEKKGPIATLLPDSADAGLTFTPTHPETKDALTWMGFEAREAILDVLDRAVADQAAEVRVVAYDLNEPDLVSRLEQLGDRLKVIIDDSDSHGEEGSAENEAARRLRASAGRGRVRRQHMGDLQHNKTVIVDGPKAKLVVCGSTNFSWRGLYVQANNAIVLRGDAVVRLFSEAFDSYWSNRNEVAVFGNSESANLAALGFDDIDADVAFSPHVRRNALLAKVAKDIGENTTSSLLYSLAFLYQTPGKVRDAIAKITGDSSKFVYGISDHPVGGLGLMKPSGNLVPVHPEALTTNVPEPFQSEPIGGSGTRMHHKFVVIDFDKPTARVYMGSYNFSVAADTKNGENLLSRLRARRRVVFVPGDRSSPRQATSRLRARRPVVFVPGDRSSPRHAASARAPSAAARGVSRLSLFCRGRGTYVGRP